MRHAVALKRWDLNMSDIRENDKSFEMKSWSIVICWVSIVILWASTLTFINLNSTSSSSNNKDPDMFGKGAQVLVSPTFRSFWIILDYLYHCGGKSTLTPQNTRTGQGFTGCLVICWHLWVCIWQIFCHLWIQWLHKWSSSVYINTVLFWPTLQSQVTRPSETKSLSFCHRSHCLPKNVTHDFQDFLSQNSS